MEKIMQFSKMHGLGNDFMIVDSITQNISFSQELIIKLADRHIGIGFDQMLLVEESHNPKLDFHYRIFNSDGTEVSQCGNGARCLGLFVKMKGLTNKNHINVSTKKSNIAINIINKNFISVNMGEPDFNPQNIPFITDKIDNLYFLNINKKIVKFSLVSISNPHCVIQVENIKNSEIELLGPILEKHKVFPKHINVGFMEIVNSNYILLRVYERGSGETQSCGTGACAAVASGIKRGILKSNVKVDLPGGTLQINWKGFGNPLFMIGSATHVYDGFINL